MKKPLLMIALSALAGVSNAQVTLTAAGVNPVLGETVNMNNGNYTSPGSAGTSQTWDLTGIGAGTPAGAATIVNASATANAASFPGATIALDNTTSGSAQYYKTTSTAWQNYGVYVPGTALPNSNPEDLLHFPFSHGNSFTDSWAGQFVSGGYTFYRTGSTTVTADGYGTLTTPNGTYSNVMRVHFVQTYQDSAYVGVPYVITYVNDEYMWYKEGIHSQVAVVYTLTSSAGGPYTGGSYITGTVGVEESSLLSSFDVYPNPASEILNLNLSVETQAKLDVVIYNSLGQQVMNVTEGNAVTGANLFSVDVATLNEGVYFVQVLLDGKPAQTKRFTRIK
jgi:hypothetical protein